MSQEEILKKLKTDLATMCGQLTYSFNEPAVETEARVRKECIATLKGYLGEEMRLNPEQMERFKEAALARQNDHIPDRPGVIKMTIEMDSEGRLSIVTRPT